MTTPEEIEGLSIVDLNRHAVKVCRHCDKWKTQDCKAAGGLIDSRSKVDWSSLSPCEIYQPNETAKYALELLTIAKLEGKTIKRRTKLEEYFKPKNKYGEP
jgi:hypothetical protein